jgi:hypothetical protein
MTAKQAGGGLTRFYFEKQLWVVNVCKCTE